MPFGRATNPFHGRRREEVLKDGAMQRAQRRLRGEQLTRLTVARTHDPHAVPGACVDMEVARQF